MLSEFKTFIMRGNVVDLAVGVIIGASFGAIVTSLVNDVVMPPIGRLLGGVDFKDFFINLSGQSYPTLAVAKAAGAPTLNYGMFLNAVINFLIVSFAVFLLVQQVNRLFPKPAAPRGGADQGMLLVRDGDPGAGEAVPALHLKPGVGLNEGETTEASRRRTISAR